MSQVSRDQVPLPSVRGVSTNEAQHWLGNAPNERDTVGEGLVVRDFTGQIVDTIAVTASGAFHTSHGIVDRDNLGMYILQLVNHPSLRRK